MIREWFDSLSSCCYFPRSITLIGQEIAPLNVFPSKNAFKYEVIFGC